MFDKNEKLVKVKEFLKKEMSETAYKTWIENLEIDCINDDEIVLVAFSELQKNRIEVFYSNYISEVFNLYMDKYYKINVIVNMRNSKNIEENETVYNKIFSKDEILEKVKKLLKEEMTSLSYTTWIKNLEIESIKDNKIVLIALSKMQKDAIESKLLELVTSAFNFVTSEDCEIEIKEKSKINSKETELKDDTDFVNSDNYNNTFLNPKYTFDNFIRGENNRFALAVAIEVIDEVTEKSPSFHKPLFIYGNSGVGKTHLMHAIGNKIIENNPNAKVLYVTAEQFNNELINSIKEGDNKTELFRDKYRNIDVLLIDDIQFIKGKKLTQNELYCLSGAISINGGQMIVSSNMLPEEIWNFEEGIRHRFDRGIIADIEMPYYETRLTILKEKVKENNIIIDDCILELIAEKVDSSLMELENTLNKIVASLTNTPITRELAEESMNSIIQEKNNN